PRARRQQRDEPARLPADSRRTQHAVQPRLLPDQPRTRRQVPKDTRPHHAQRRCRPHSSGIPKISCKFQVSSSKLRTRHPTWNWRFVMATFERFEDIEAWKKTRLLVNVIYKMTAVAEFARDYGLKDQIRRAAVSVLSNIAEGFEREGKTEFRRFLTIAKGSCGEVRAQLYVALDQ